MCVRARVCDTGMCLSTRARKCVRLCMTFHSKHGRRVDISGLDDLGLWKRSSLEVILDRDDCGGAERDR